MNYGENERQEEADGRTKTNNEEEEEERVLRNRRLWSFKMAGPEERSRTPRSTVYFDCLPGNRRRHEPTDRPTERTNEETGWMDGFADFMPEFRLAWLPPLRRRHRRAAVAESPVRSADVSFHQAFVPKIGRVCRGTGYFSQGKFTPSIFLAAVHI